MPLNNAIKTRHKKIASLAKGKILDIGYADRPNLFLKGEVVGIDLVKIDKPVNYSRIVQGDALHLKNFFPVEEFDTIIAAEIIEHLENPSEFLRSASKVLKGDGRLIISTPNPYHLPTLLANLLFRKPEFTAHKTHDPYHINLFPYMNMVTLLEHCDFRLEEVVNANGLVIYLKKSFFIPFPKSLSHGLIYLSKKAKGNRGHR